MIYLASPYSHPDRLVREERFQKACRIAGALIAAGKHVYSPISHSHPICVLCNVPTDWEFWRKYDRHWIEKCSELWVVKMDGWSTSKGIKGELLIAEVLGKPVKYIEEPNFDDTNWLHWRPQP